MERNVTVDRLKGYACFLVLFGHVIMGIRLAGIEVPEFIWGLEKFIWSFHVALFLFLSGVVYQITGEWRGKKSKGSFILHKLYNLGVPYIAFSALYVAINSLVGGANTGFAMSDLLNIWKAPIAQYWFLYSLFFLFCIWTLLSGVLKNWQITLLTALVGYLAPLCGIPLGGLDVVFYSALAFGVGTFADIKRIAKCPTWIKVLVVALHIAIGGVFVALNRIGMAGVKEAMLLLGIYASILLISMLQNCRPAARLLDFVNRYSFQIYLLHTIFTAGVRIVLLRIGVELWWLHVLLGTVFGLAGPVAAAVIAKKVSFLNFFFFPSKVYPLHKSKR